MIPTIRSESGVDPVTRLKHWQISLHGTAVQVDSTLHVLKYNDDEDNLYKTETHRRTRGLSFATGAMPFDSFEMLDDGEDKISGASLLEIQNVSLDVSIPRTRRRCGQWIGEGGCTSVGSRGRL